MTPSEVINQITSEMVAKAVTDFASGKIVHDFHDSERYDVLHEGVRYPPKALIGLAAAYVPGGRLLSPSDFSGGLGSTCFRTLTKLGFSVVRKEGVRPPATEFEIGNTYNRKSDIHGVFGGQERGGIATPANFPFVFLFSGERGDAYGYKDEFRDSDGVFLYTGEGQVGDMKLTKGNAAIANAASVGKRIFLFKEASKGHVTFQGEAEYLSHYWVDRPDGDGNTRKAIVFELSLTPRSRDSEADAIDVPPEIETLPKKTLAELRKLALVSASRAASPVVKSQLTRIRSEAIRRYTLKRANGKCEGCGGAAPFKNRKNEPYLEPHHTTRLADGGPDHPANVIALCPTCHRRAHHALDAELFNASLRDTLKRLEVGTG